MKEIIKILVNDHKKITNKINEIETLMNKRAEESFPKIINSLLFFKEFTFSGHHQRENEILYAWMTSQNPNADRSIVNRITTEHKVLEALAEKLLTNINDSINKTPKCSNVTILSDLQDFISIYREHIEKEEKFIFVIAEGLQLSDEKKLAMLKKMQTTILWN